MSAPLVHLLNRLTVALEGVACSLELSAKSPCAGSLREMERDAVHFLRSNLVGRGRVFVGFSGGKDSIVTDKLMRLSGLPYTLYHSFTGIDAPEVVRFIKHNYPSTVILRPKMSFWHGILTKNPPANFSRWCCQKLKKEPSYAVPLRHRVFGIRAEESTKRGKYKRVNFFKKQNITAYYPILDWSEWQIWDFIEAYKLPYPTLYDEGFDRIGCIVCPYHSSATGDGHKMYRERWPRVFKLFDSFCTKWFYKRSSQGKQMYFPSPEEFLREWYAGNVKWYAHDPI